MIARILLLVLGGGAAVGITRYVANFFISGTVFSSNVTSGFITRIDGSVVPFVGTLAGNNTVHYLIPLAILIAILIGIFMAIKRKVKRV